MVMVLPEGIPTLEPMETKNLTHPNYVFGSHLLEDKVVFCTTDPRLRGPGTNHIMILISLDLPITKSSNLAMCIW